MASLTTPTFIIGLGGIGQKVTFLVANRFENSRWGEVPETMRIRAIDSAPAEAFEIPVSRCRYFTQLGPFDANQTIQNIELFPEINKWWDYPGLTPGFIAMGAGAKRPVGRLVFFRQFAKLYGVLKDDFRVPLAETLQQRLIAEGLDRVKIQQPQVYIVGSLAGGTCSGMLIDTAFLIRKLLQDVGYESGGINITAILGLQSVIEVAAHDGILNAARDRRLNAYAAVREIDYLFNGWPQDFQLDYPAPMHSFKPDQPLFNQVYLFTTAQLGGFFFNDQREILTRVAHFIFGQVASETGAVAATILDNRKDAFNPDQRRFGDGLKAIYGAFGVEWLDVPHQYLINRWCTELAERIGALITEFEWGKEPRVNLTQKFRELLSSEMQGYRKALDFLTAGPENIITVDELSPLTDHLNAIQAAKKGTELNQALHDLDIDLPKLTGRVRSAVSVTASSAEEDDWLISTVQTLFEDRKFRLGGARRVLEEAAAQLRKIGERIDLQLEAIDAVVKKSKGFWGHMNTGPALEWARKKVYQATVQTVRQSVGGRADRLAARCGDSAAGVERLQEQVRRAVENLQHMPRQDVLAATDNWILNQEDIDRALQDNPDEVARGVADHLARTLARELSTATLPQMTIPNLEKNFPYWVEPAIEKAIAPRIKRPADNLERLKRRIASCEPLARIITDGPEFLKIMKSEDKSTPLKIVLTGLGPEERRELDDWATLENQQFGGEKAYEVLGTGENLRDDVLHLTLGWPLRLFDEIRTWDHSFEEIKSTNPALWQTAFILSKQFPDSVTHEIKPMEKTEAERWFGIALAFWHLDFKGTSLVFEPAVFPNGGEVDDPNIEVRLHKAFTRFRQLGFTWKYERFVKSEERRDSAGFRLKLLEGVQKRKEALETAHQEGQITRDLYQKLFSYYRLADEYAKRIVIL